MDEQAMYTAGDTAGCERVFPDEQTLCREEALAKREAEVARREMRAAAAERLNELKLPSGLIACMNFTSQESYEESFGAVCDSFSEAIREGMRQRVHADVPKKSAAGAPDAFLEGLGIIK